MQPSEGKYHLVGQTYKTLNKTAEGFAAGWLTGTAIICSGKIWSVLINSQVKVSKLIGYIGKPVFRRQLAVGFAVFSLTQSLFQQLVPSLNSDSSSLKLRVSRISTQAFSVILGVTAAAMTTHFGYHVIAYSVAAFYAIEAIRFAKNYLSKAEVRDHA